MLEIDVSTVSLNTLSKLYADFGDGLSEENSFILPLKTGVNKRICYFPRPIKRLLFYPDETKFFIDDLVIRFTKITKRFAMSRMLKKLNESRSTPSDETLNFLYRRYDKLFRKKLSVSYQHWIIHSEPKHWLPVIDDTRIKFSIIIPVFNSKPCWIVSCIQSIINQSYSNFELILVDDASTEKTTLSTLNDIENRDPRIQVIYRKANGHISQATNTGIEKARGDYILFLDHDDMLASHALNEIAHAIANNEQAEILYSDEDLMSEAGERVTPHFKADWNYDLLLSHNYITHLCCYKKSVIDALQGLREGFEGAQDYELILRASEIVDVDNIYHIPKVLYHWRMVEGSTALSASAKSYTVDAGKRALEAHLARKNTGATACPTDKPNFYRVNWAIPTKTKISVIIPTRDGLAVLKPCIDSLLKTMGEQRLEIVIVDNGSMSPDTLLYLRQLADKPMFKIIRHDAPFNYSRLNNLGVSGASGDVLLFLNDDTEAIEHGWLQEMLSLTVRPLIGCVGAKLLYPDGNIQHAGVILGLGGYAAHAHRGFPANGAGYFNRAQLRQNFSAVTAACMMVRREVFDAVGGFDEAFEVAYNDVDFCLKVKAVGFDNCYTPYATLLHHESKTRGEDTTPAKQARFDQEKARLATRWRSIIDHDPAYNPNLTRSKEDFSIAYETR